MRNAVSKELLKTAFGYDPADVARELATASPESAGAAKALARGQSYVSGAGSVAQSLPRAAVRAYEGAEKLLAPAGPGVANALGRVGRHFQTHPTHTRAAIGATLLAPILAQGFHEGQQGHETMRTDLRRDPSRTITASLDEFLAQKAEEARHTPRDKMALFDPGWHGDVFKGIGNAAGKTLAEGAISLVGGAYGALADHFSSGPQRKRVLDSLLRTDPVLSDAVKRNPMAATIISEAFATMIRFAPSLSTDVNAVRSFLREAAIGGGGVNYATIKNLIDTEKALRGPGK